MIDSAYRLSADSNTNYHTDLGLDVRKSAWLRGFWGCLESLPITTKNTEGR